MLAILTGLAAEADILRAAGIQGRILCCGARPAVARADLRRLVDDGATAVLSFGVGGALAEIAQPGQIVLAEAVVLPDGRRRLCDPTWHQALAQRLADLPVRLHRGAIAGSAEPVCTPAAKQALRLASGALAVDMESQVAAEVAAAAALPFLALRAISDGAGQTVPAFAMGGVDAAGKTRVLPVLAGLLRQPAALPDLLRLGRHFNAALAGLRAVAALASPDLACHTLEAGETEVRA